MTQMMKSCPSIWDRNLSILRVRVACRQMTGWTTSIDAEPRTMDYNTKYLVMPMRPSLLDTMRKDIEDTDEKWEPPPASPERASTPTMVFSYDYATDEPPDIQRVEETPMHSSPYP